MSTDLGPPTSYLTLPEGVPVLSSDGHELGRVAHVLADPEEDIFDGLVVDARGRHLFVDAPQVAGSTSAASCWRSTPRPPRGCPSRPRARPRCRQPGRHVPDGLGDKLRRAWDYLSGTTSPVRAAPEQARGGRPSSG